MPTGISEKSIIPSRSSSLILGCSIRAAYSIDCGDGSHSAPLSITTQGGTLTASHKFQIDGRAGSKSQTFVVTIGVNDNSGAVGTATSTVVVTGGGAE